MPGESDRVGDRSRYNLRVYNAAITMLSQPIRRVTLLIISQSGLAPLLV